MSGKKTFLNFRKLNKCIITGMAINVAAARNKGYKKFTWAKIRDSSQKERINRVAIEQGIKVDALAVLNVLFF